MSLRIAAWSNMHTRILSGCSTFNSVVDMCNQLHSDDPSFYAYMFTRDKYKSDFEMAERFYASKAITWLECGPKKRWNVREAVPLEAINRIKPPTFEYPYDLLWTMDIHHSFQFSLYLKPGQSRWDMPMTIPVVAGMDEHFKSESETSDAFLRHPITSTILMSLLMADHPFVVNQHQLKDVGRVTRNLLNSAQVSKLSEKLALIRTPCKLDHLYDKMDEFEQQRQERLKNDPRLTVFNAGTFIGKRHLPEICEGLDKLEIGARGQFKFLNLSQHEKGSLSTKRIPSELRLSQDRPKFHKALGEGDILLVICDWMGTGLGYAEAIATGMIPIFSNHEWLKERMPKDYPYVIDGNKIAEQLPLAVKHIKKNYLDAKGWALKVREIWSEWDSRKVSKIFKDYLSEIANLNRRKCYEKLVKFPGAKAALQAIDEMPDEFIGFDELRRRISYICKESDNLEQKWSATALRWMLLENGFLDKGGETPEFKHE